MFDKNNILTLKECLDTLLQRLKEPAPGRIQLLVGPRQIGKTTLLLELERQIGPSAVYVALDSPEASLLGFWERFWASVEARAKAEEKITVLLDEAHTFPQWSRLLKGQWDRIAKMKWPIHIVATGSSALKITHGSKESLAGRFERFVLTHWTASDLIRAFLVSKEQAVQMYVERGAYPGAFPYVADFPRWKAYVRDSIIETAIGRDILALAPIRKPALLRQVFAVCVSMPCQIISLQKMMGQLQDAGAIETLAYYLSLLEEAFLIAVLPKYASQAIRMRASPPKIVLLSNAFLAATDQTLPPDAKHDPKRYGSWVENSCLARAWNAGQTIFYWREEPFEVDAVLEGSWGKWAIEVKTGYFDSTDLQGLFVFTQKYPEFKPLLLCDAAGVERAKQMHLAAMSWQEFLLQGLVRQ